MTYYDIAHAAKHSFETAPSATELRRFAKALGVEYTPPSTTYDFLVSVTYSGAYRPTKAETRKHIQEGIQAKLDWWADCAVDVRKLVFRRDT